MSEFNFKAGDKVYYPIATNEVLTISSDMRVWYLGIDAENTNAIFRPNGRLYKQHHNPAIFPATQEWYDKLVHVYPDLEKPPVKKSSKEIIQAMLDDGWSGVPCYVSDFCSDDKTKKDIIVQFDRIEDYVYRTTRGYGWQYATPFDPRTDKTIIDFANGEVVLGD